MLLIIPIVMAAGIEVDNYRQPLIELKYEKL